MISCCDSCDGFPCLVQGKADAEVNGINLIRDRNNITLLTQAKATKLLTNASGLEVTAVEADVNGQSETFYADIIVVACGAINSAVLLLQSANDKHPNGVANGSDLVGHNLMKHLTTAMVAMTTTPN